jgi:hypothetical protein
VVRLVQPLVEEGNVQPPVDPVDAEVGEEEEDTRRKRHVQPRQRSALRTERTLLNRVIEHRPPPNISDEPREGEEVQHRERLERVGNLLRYLVLEEPRVELHPLVEDAVVGEGGDGEVHQDDADIGDEVEGEGLAEDGVAAEGGERGEGGEVRQGDGSDAGCRRKVEGGERGEGGSRVVIGRLGGVAGEGVVEVRVELVTDVLVEVVKRDVHSGDGNDEEVAGQKERRKLRRRRERRRRKGKRKVSYFCLRDV